MASVILWTNRADKKFDRILQYLMVSNNFRLDGITQRGTFRRLEISSKR